MCFQRRKVFWLSVILLLGCSMRVNAVDSHKIKIVNISSQSARVVLKSEEQFRSDLFVEYDKEVLIDAKQAQIVLLSRKCNKKCLYLYWNNNPKYDIHIESRVPKQILITDDSGVQVKYPDVKQSRERGKRGSCFVQ